MSGGIGITRRSSTGQMRHRIIVQTATRAVDSSRQPVVTYVDRLVNEPAAVIDPQSGAEAMNGRQVEAMASIVFKVNYRDGYSPTDRIVWDGQNYGIVSIQKPDGVGRFLLLGCRAVVP